MARSYERNLAAGSVAAIQQLLTISCELLPGGWLATSRQQKLNVFLLGNPTDRCQ